MTLVFSLVGGLLVAIAIQLVFANLGIALGLTVLDWAPVKGAAERIKGNNQETDKSLETEASPEAPEGGPQQSLPITPFLGFGVAVGFSGVIFISTLISVEFAQLFEPRRGIIFGLIFWSTYWLLFTWISSTTIAGIADSLLGTALKGGKQLVSTLKEAVNQPTESAEKEPSAERSMLQTLIEEVSELAENQKDLPTLLANQRETLLEEICDRTSLSTAEAETIVEELETPISSPIPPSPTAAPSIAKQTLLSQLNLPSWQQVLRRTLDKVDLSDWDVETLWQQLPLDSDKVQYATAQFVESATAVLPGVHERESTQPTKEQPTKAQPAKAQPAKAQPTKAQLAAIKAIQAKVISYCRYTSTDALSPEKLVDKLTTQQREHGLTNDSDLLQTTLDIKAIESVLSRRKKLTPEKRKKLIVALQHVCPSANESAAEPKETTDISIQQFTEQAYETIEAQLKTVDWSKTSLEDIKPEVMLLLEQIERTSQGRSLDWSTLTSRIQLPATIKEDFINWFDARWRAQVQSLHPAAAVQGTQHLSQQLAGQINHYLHHQEKSELSPTEIAQNLTQMVGSAIATLPQPSELANISEISELIDTDTWKQQLWNPTQWRASLEKRKDLTAEEIQQILEWGEQVWEPKVQQVTSWLQAA
ncbi:MAG: hypothetical protein AAFO84_13000, partial [Cyanobacteria bacterium J06598_1]